MASLAPNPESLRHEGPADSSASVFRLGDRRPPAPAVLTLAGPHVARVSLAWLDASGQPVAVRTASGARTLVVVWPTKVDGRLASRRLPEAYVAELRLTELELQDVEELHADYPLRDHDLLISARGISPCSESLLRSPCEAHELVAVRRPLRAGIKQHLTHLSMPPRPS